MEPNGAKWTHDDVQIFSAIAIASQNSPGSLARLARCASTAGFSIHFIVTRLLQLTVVLSARVNYSASAACDKCSSSSQWICRSVTMWNQHWNSYIGCRLSKEEFTSCVCLCTTSTSDKHQDTFQTVFPQFLQPVADIDLGPLTQRLTFCQEQEQNLVNVASSTSVQPPGTLFRQTFMTLLIRVHSENDSRMYFLIVLTTDYCWRSWTTRIAAPYYKSHVDWLIACWDWFSARSSTC